MEMEKLLEWVFGVNSGFFSPKNKYRASAGDALIRGNCKFSMKNFSPNLEWNSTFKFFVDRYFQILVTQDNMKVKRLEL